MVLTQQFFMVDKMNIIDTSGIFNIYSAVNYLAGKIFSLILL